MGANRHIRVEHKIIHPLNAEYYEQFRPWHHIHLEYREKTGITFWWAFLFETPITFLRGFFWFIFAIVFVSFLWFKSGMAVSKEENNQRHLASNYFPGKETPTSIWIRVTIGIGERRVKQIVAAVS